MISKKCLKAAALIAAVVSAATARQSDTPAYLLSPRQDDYPPATCQLNKEPPCTTLDAQNVADLLKAGGTVLPSQTSTPIRIESANTCCLYGWVLPGGNASYSQDIGSALQDMIYKANSGSVGGCGFASGNQDNRFFLKQCIPVV